MELYVETDNSFQLKNYCRLCASFHEEDTNLIQISESEYNLFSLSAQPIVIDIPKFLENALEIKINDNKSLPTQICKKCIDVLINFFYFKIKCHESEEILKETIKHEDIEWEYNLFEGARFDEKFENRSDDDNHLNDDNVIIKTEYDNNLLNNKDNSTNIISQNKHICLDCHESFPKKCQLQIHRKMCELKGSEDSKRKGPYTCEQCGKILATLVGYSVHKKMHVRQENNLNNKKKKEQNQTELNKKLDIHVCYICGKTFKQSGALKLHIQFHTKTKPFECNKCRKKFYTKSILKDHMNIHTSEKQFICPTCDKSFFTYRQMRKHVVIHRTDARKLQCTMCPKKFIYPYEIQMHMMVHTGNKPHSCNICDLKFRFTWDLKKHNEKTHKIEINNSNVDTKIDGNISTAEVLPIKLMENDDEESKQENSIANNENGEIFLEYM